MPRRHKLTRQNLEFTIHEDDAAAATATSGMETDSDVRDFATEPGMRESETFPSSTSAVHNEATDSNMTKASTLVNEDFPPEEQHGEEKTKDGLEERLDNMLEELKGEIRGAEQLVGGKLEEDEKERRESVDSWDVGGRRESSFSEGTHEEATESSSRRESMLTTETRDAPTEESASRRHSGVSTATHDDTEASTSRRESALSNASWQSDRRRSYHSETADESVLSHYPDDSLHESTHDQSTLNDGTQASTSDGQSSYGEHEDSVLDEEQPSRRESGAEQDSTRRRASERTEALIQAAARGIVEQISRSAQSSRAGERESTHASPRASDVQASVADEKSARSSDAHASVAAEEQSHSKPASARVSEAHEPLADEENTQSKVASARVSDAPESVATEENVGSKAASARVSEVQEPAADEEAGGPEVTSTRVSDAQEPVVEDAKARISSAHQSVVDEEETKRVASARPSDVHDPVSRQASARTSAAHEPPAEETVLESIEHDEQPLAAEEEAGSSSHNENDDDVFSDHSPRSSVGSISGEDQQRKLSHENITQRKSTRSARMSDFSHYDTDDQDEEFIPTVRGTPRPPFRSPSSVKAMQMSSPPASVLGSSRSSRRTPLPTVSRIGSPSAQYSPKKTPPRFKRNTPPLVLLHVTLLPLRWPWGDVLDVAQVDEFSEGGKSLREAWRQLQERMGDTTCERGILLPHPQNDFEVLEERLLEALELPLRRRARILECGHYLGPSNDLTLLDDSDSEDEDYYPESPRQSRASANKDTHWCATCHSEIRYDSLGLGKVFRVKVYASNGLIRAGAWEACWKEMERVDVEIEPIVETEVHEELVRLDNEQQRAVELQQEEAQRMEEEAIYAEEEYAQEDELTELHHDIPPSSPPEIRVISEPEPPTSDEERRLRDEARLREIYGQTPPAASEPTPAEEVPSSEYVHHRTPPSPAAEAYTRREERRQSVRSDSLPDLIFEAVKLAMQDRKNVVIALMSVLVLALAIRTGGSGVGQDPASFHPIVKEQPAVVTVTERAQEVSTAAHVIAESAAPVVQSPASSATSVVREQAVGSEGVDPCSTASSQGYQQAMAEQETVVSERVVTVVETLTETSYETATVTAQPDPEETLAQVEEETGQVSEAEEDLSEATESVVEVVEPAVAVEEDLMDVMDEVLDETGVAGEL